MIGRELRRFVSSPSSGLVRRLSSRQWLPADVAPNTLAAADAPASVVGTGTREARGVTVFRPATFTAARRLPARRTSGTLAVMQMRFSSRSATAPSTAEAAAATNEVFDNFSRTMDPAGFIEELVAKHPVLVISKETCPFCKRAKNLLTELGAAFESVELDSLSSEAKLVLQGHLRATTGAGSVPRVYISGKCIGGFDETQRKLVAGDLVPALIGVGAADGSAPKAKMFTDINPFF